MPPPAPTQAAARLWTARAPGEYQPTPTFPALGVDEMHTLAHLKSALDIKLCPQTRISDVNDAERFEASKGAMQRSVLQSQTLHAVSSTDCSIKLSFQEHWTITLSIFNITAISYSPSAAIMFEGDQWKTKA